MSVINQPTDGNRFQNFPAIHLFIKDLQQGQWIDEEKAVSSKYGRIKRCMIYATVINRKDFIPNSQEDSFLDESFTQNTRISFQIDDGTGRMWVSIFGIDINDYDFLQKGVLVEVVGKPRFFRNSISLVGEFARKIEDPNWETYHILKVLHRRKFKPSFEIEHFDTPSFTEFDFDAGSLTENNPEQDISDLNDDPNLESEDQLIEEFSEDLEQISEKIKTKSNEDPFLTNSIMDEIVSFIQNNDDGDGVAVTAIQENFKLDLNTLKDYLEQLTQDIKIYKTNVGYYSAYD